MFGNMGNLGKLMKMAGEMRQKMPEMREKLANAEYTADAGGGAVSATVNGRMQLTDLKIDPQVIGDSEPEILEDLIKAAVTAAQQKAADAAEEAMKELTGDMELPGGMQDLLGM